MKVNGEKHENYLKPYKDEEMVCEALIQYANRRHAYAMAISQTGFKHTDGTDPSKEEIHFAIEAAQQADRLVGYAMEKVESPIIQLQ